MIRAAVWLLLSALPATLSAGTHRYGVVVGNNRGHHVERELRFAERDARRVHEVMLELGGFAPERLRLLLGGTADDVWQAIREVQPADPAERTLFLFYFSGHAEDDFLELGSTTLRFSDIRALLRDSPATTRIAFIDSCHSGSLVSTKGGTRQPGYEIAVVDELVSSGYAIITSGAEDELSQESTEIRGAYFTHYLVSGLRGAADQSADGRVTLTEAYQHAYSRTVARTSRSLGGTQHPMYELDLAGQGEVVLTRQQAGNSTVAVTPPEDGRIVVLDDERERMVAEADGAAGEPVRLGVPPGRFRVFVVSGDALAVARVEVSAGGVAEVAHFETARAARPVANGGLIRRGWSHQVGATGVVRRWPLGDTVGYGGGIEWHATGPWPIEPVARLIWTTAADRGASSDYHDLALTAGVARTWTVDWLALRLAGLAGYEHLFQSGDRHSGGFTYLALASAETGIGPLRFALGAGAGGHLFKLRGKGLTHRIDVQAAATVGWLFRAQP